MKKYTLIVALFFIGAISYAQIKQNNSAIKAGKIIKSVNNLHQTPKSVIDSLHYDGDNAYGIGTESQPSIIGAYAFFPAANTAAHHVAGNAITSVKVYINGDTSVTSATLNVFSNQGIDTLISQNFVPVNGWNEILLSAPLLIPATDLYIGYTVVTTGGLPLGCDSSLTPVSNGNWIVFNDTWQHLNDISVDLTGSWNIRAMISGAALTNPIAFCTPLVWEAGDVVVGKNLTSPSFSLQNVGAGTLTVSGITGLNIPYSTSLVPDSVSLTAGQSIGFTFTFVPTISGAVNQTVLIATNAGIVTIDLSGNGISCNAHDLPFVEGFETPDICLDINDANQDSFTWKYWENTNWAHSGNKFAIYLSNTDGATPGDDWLILPGINLLSGTTYKIDFWHKVFDDAFPESFQVKIGNAPVPGSLTTTIVDLPNQSDTAWTNQVSTFTIPANGVYYVAFYCNSQPDEWRLGIDDVTIDVSNGIVENAQEVVSLFPNPANDKLFISSSKINAVEIYNLTGAKVASFGNQNVINISDLAQGPYLVKVITDYKVTTKKINIIR